MNTDVVLKSFIYDNGHYVYCPYSNKLLKITREHFSELKNLEYCGFEKYALLNKNCQSYKDIMFLIEKGIIRKSPIETICHPLTNYIDLSLSRGVNFIILQVTKDCNFSCRYCLFADESSNNVNLNHNKHFMSFETARKSIDFLYDHSKDASDLMISFYGGEPLLNKELIFQSVEYAESRFLTKKLKFGMTTNGSLINNEIIEYFIMHNFYLTISLDGYPELQNSHRKFRKSGQATFTAVWNNVQKIKKLSEEYFATHVVFHPVIFADEDYDSVLNFFISNGVREENVSIQHANTQGIDYTLNGILTTKYNNSSDKNEYTKQREILNDQKPVPPIWHHNGPCVPGISRLYVDINENLYPCEKTCSMISIGNLRDGFFYDKASTILNIGQLSANHCKRCWAFRFCSMCVIQCVDLSTNKIDPQVKEMHCQNQKNNALRFLENYIKKEMQNTPMDINKN